MLRIHLVGAGTPTPSPDRFGTCYVAETGTSFLMFDCGPAATHKMVKMGLDPTDVTHLFFSHHHFDHNADYPCFLLCRWDQAAGRRPPLKVFGPPPTAMVTQHLIAENGAFYPDWKARVEHPGSREIFQKRGGELPRKPPQIEVHDIDTGYRIEDQDWQITCSRVKHIEPWMPTLAYRLEAEGISLVITSDTEYCQSVIDLAKGADHLLIHCWDLQERMGPAEAGMITGTVKAAEVAKQAGVGRLWLSHLGPHLDQPDSRERAVTDVAGVFQGDFVFVDELSVLELR